MDSHELQKLSLSFVSNSLMDFSFLNPGFFDKNTLKRLLDRHLPKNFTSLKTKFYAVATNLNTGDPVLFSYWRFKKICSSLLFYSYFICARIPKKYTLW